MISYYKKKKIINFVKASSKCNIYKKQKDANLTIWELLQGPNAGACKTSLEETWIDIIEDLLYKENLLPSLSKTDRLINVLLHEFGHYLRDAHVGYAALSRTYSSNIGRYKSEQLAWYHAFQIAKMFNIKLNKEYVKLCLKGYRKGLGIKGPSIIDKKEGNI